MLTLPIKRKWFDMICKCQKRDLSRKDLEAVYIGKNFQKEEAEK
ncbi:hypothetical protein [uncultured Gemmiger sp.]|nr:hypothetical protein [uncultured Gemmiger sp.]